MPVATLLRAAAGALALDDVELAQGGIFALTVGELAAQRGTVEHAFSHDLARLARRLARLGGDHGLLEDLTGGAGILLEVAAEALA